MKDRLIDLLKKVDENAANKGITDYKDAIADNADYLLANGVIVPPVFVGQTVYVLNQTNGKVYQNTVVCIKVRSMQSKLKNTIKVEYINKLGETSCRKFAWAQIGKQVFFTREEAEKALAERRGE